MDDSLQPASRIELSMTSAKATFWSLVFGLPPACLPMYFYLWRWGAVLNVNRARTEDFLYFIASLFATLTLGSVLHELIHGLSWAYFGHKRLDKIEYGFHWQMLAPYAHCREPIEVGAYRLGGIMPLVLLGVLPALVGIGTGNGWIMFFGFFFTIAAGGDMLVLWLIREVRPGQFVEDHPTRVGCYLIGTPPE